MSKPIQKAIFPYQPFNNFVFRTPLYSFQHFFKTIELLNKNEAYWFEFLKDNLLQEAIFLASPNLYQEICKFLNNNLPNAKEIEQLKMSVMRYFTRMCTRCTPFGLFAGISMGEINNSNSVILSDIDKYQRFTRLDMNFLCEMSINLSKSDSIREKLRYYPNNSIYKVGEKYRYIEYQYINTRRINKISAFDYSEYLQELFKYAIFGATIDELANLLVDDEITYNEAKEFILELIDNQIIVSELYPNVTGEDLLLRIINILTKYGFTEKCNLLNDITLKLIIADSSIQKKDIEIYNSIVEIINKTNVEYDPKFLFQCDMYKPVEKAELSGKIVEVIKNTLHFLNKISLPPTEAPLTKFIFEFSERYETMELPLLEALDNEIGLGYQTNSGDSSPLIDDIIVSNRNNSSAYDIKWSRVQSVLLNKIVESKVSKTFSIELLDKDFDFLTSNYSDLPQTLSTMVRVFSYKSEDDFLISCQGFGGSSGANILARFSHLNTNIEEHVKNIITNEHESQTDVIHAEIVHLPESRIGNILFRPVLRQYEIPYLANSGVENEFQIAVSDLFISVNNGRLMLRSKKLNKEIVPHLTTAHNYSLNAMPVYHFLCDLQMYNKRMGIGFGWGTLENEFDFLPRITHNNVIISLAKWKIKVEELIKAVWGDAKAKHNFISGNDFEKLTEWRKNKILPNYVSLSDGDNQLFVDFSNPLSINTLISIIKNRQIFILEEYPFDIENQFIRDEQGNAYANEFVLSFSKYN